MQNLSKSHAQASLPPTCGTNRQPRKRVGNIENLTHTNETLQNNVKKKKTKLIKGCTALDGVNLQLNNLPDNLNI